MKKNNIKAFTLVEILAVIAILAVVIVIATNSVLKSVRKSKENSVIANAKTFIKAVNEKASTARITGELNDGTYTLSELYASGVALSGTKPTTGGVTISENAVVNACFTYDDYKYTYSSGEENLKKTGNCDAAVYEFPYGTNGEYTFTAEDAGRYKFEAWGAQGGSGNFDQGGYGAYTSGYVNLNSNQVIYIFIGTQPTNSNGGHNGGGNGSGDQYKGGGGATDFRTEQNNLNSRIMVAAGGGASYNYGGNNHMAGGHAGALIGLPGAATRLDPSTGGTQISGGLGNNAQSAYNGSFGLGGNGSGNLGTGGGAGWYGGGATYNVGGSSESGAGGSSYISGYLGCVGVTSSSSTQAKCTAEAAASNVTCSESYTGLIFNNGVMIAGNDSMPSYSSNDETIGNAGNGYARITYYPY